jgi:hypothetical protein
VRSVSERVLPGPRFRPLCSGVTGSREEPRVCRLPAGPAGARWIRTLRPSRDQCLSELVEPCAETTWRARGEFLRGGTNSSNPSPSSNESANFRSLQQAAVRLAAPNAQARAGLQSAVDRKKMVPCRTTTNINAGCIPFAFVLSRYRRLFAKNGRAGSRRTIGSSAGDIGCNSREAGSVAPAFEPFLRHLGGTLAYPRPRGAGRLERLSP